MSTAHQRILRRSAGRYKTKALAGGTQAFAYQSDGVQSIADLGRP